MLQPTIIRMDTTSKTPNRGRGPSLYLGIIAVLTVVVTPIAGGFWVPIGPASHVQLPGVLMFVALAGACVTAFIRCPSRPRWGKIAALALSIPSLYLAVDTLFMFLAFGWKR